MHESQAKTFTHNLRIYLKVGVEDLSLQRPVLPIRGHLSTPHIGPFEGLKGGVIGLELLGKQRQKLRHVHTAKSALACISPQRCKK